MERGQGASASLETWAAVAAALDLQLVAFLEGVPGAERPRDYEYLKRQQLVIDTASQGGWVARPELLLDADAARGRSIDVALLRPVGHEAVVVEIWDFFDDVGAAKRSLDGKIATLDRHLTTTRDIREAKAFRVGGLWVVRGTKRNRALVDEFRGFFAAAFSGSSSAWLRAMSDPTASMPAGNGLVWTDAAGSRLLAARL